MKDINIKNKKAFFEYQILDKFIAGIELKGTEIKSIREGKATITEGYCFFKNNELWIKGMHITEYKLGTYANHEPKRERKLLLNNQELNKISKKIQDQGITIIPLRLFISKKGWAKIEISTAKGKKIHDKRNTIKERDIKRDIERESK